MTTQLRPTSIVKAIDLLSATKTTIKRHGRPRRRPNIDSRPLACSQHGKIVSPYSPGAARWSVPGAFKADAKALGYSQSIIAIAEMYFVSAYQQAFPYALDYVYGKKDAETVDLVEFDTREIIRALQRAIVKLQGIQS